jgi:hypothetical protein
MYYSLALLILIPENMSIPSEIESQIQQGF